jgi:hypothetical protein
MQIPVCRADVGGFMSQEFDCHYGEAEFNTIKAGIEAIEFCYSKNGVYTTSIMTAKEKGAIIRYIK